MSDLLFKYRLQIFKIEMLYIFKREQRSSLNFN